MKTGFIYLASPYTRYRAGRGMAFVEACRGAAILLSCGVPCYSPIAHMHPVAEYGGLAAHDSEYWLSIDRPQIDAARALVVYLLPGWQESHGIAAEILSFREQGKPIIYWEPSEEAPGELIDMFGGA